MDRRTEKALGFDRHIRWQSRNGEWHKTANVGFSRLSGAADASTCERAAIRRHMCSALLGPMVDLIHNTWDCAVIISGAPSSHGTGAQPI